MLSPDGRSLAFVHIDAKSTYGGGDRISLWIADGASGHARRLLAPREDRNPKRNLTGIAHPRFSLDGGYVYIDSDAWATSSAAHQVSVATGKERSVIDGGLVGVLRNGPYRGDLLLGRHKYHPAPQLEPYDPIEVVRLDRKSMLTVPGSDRDDGKLSLPAWLKAHHWTAD